MPQTSSRVLWSMMNQIFVVRSNRGKYIQATFLEVKSFWFPGVWQCICQSEIKRKRNYLLANLDTLIQFLVTSGTCNRSRKTKGVLWEEKKELEPMSWMLIQVPLPTMTSSDPLYDDLVLQIVGSLVSWWVAPLSGSHRGCRRSTERMDS